MLAFAKLFMYVCGVELFMSDCCHALTVVFSKILVLLFLSMSKSSNFRSQCICYSSVLNSLNRLEFHFFPDNPFLKNVT